MSAPRLAGEKHRLGPDREGAPVLQVPLQHLRFHPRNIRTNLGDLTALAESIRHEGVLVPLMAEKRRTGGLQLLHGHRRWAAADMVKLLRVPCTIVPEHTDDQAILLMLAENTGRADVATRGRPEDPRGPTVAARDPTRRRARTAGPVGRRRARGGRTCRRAARMARRLETRPDPEAPPRYRGADWAAVDALLTGRLTADQVRPADRRAAVHELTSRGHTAAAIADRIGLSQRQVVRLRAGAVERAAS